MQVEASVTVTLPFDLDFCAEGPSVDPITVTLDGVDVELNFPPSMAEGTDGQSFFPSGWAWWKGHSILIDLAHIVREHDLDEIEALRTRFGDAADEALRRFLNAYRIRLNQPHVHTVRINRKSVQLVLVHDNGDTEALPEPLSEFFYNKTPHDPPLQSSLNVMTVGDIEADVRHGSAATVADHVRLDASWLEALGEGERAAFLRKGL